MLGAEALAVRVSSRSASLLDAARGRVDPSACSFPAIDLRRCVILSAVQVRLLGPVEAWSAGVRVDLGPRQQRLVLAVLALETNRLVPVDRLVDLLVDGTTELDDSGAAEVALEGYGFRWLRLARPTERRLL